MARELNHRPEVLSMQLVVLLRFQRPRGSQQLLVRKLRLAIEFFDFQYAAEELPLQVLVTGRLFTKSRWLWRLHHLEDRKHIPFHIAFGVQYYLNDQLRTRKGLQDSPLSPFDLFR